VLDRFYLPNVRVHLNRCQWVTLVIFLVVTAPVELYVLVMVIRAKEIQIVLRANVWVTIVAETMEKPRVATSVAIMEIV